MRRDIWKAFGITVFCIILDYATLAILPRLGLSYGDPLAPWLIFVFVRLFLFMAWGGLYGAWLKRRRPDVGSRRMAPPLIIVDALLTIVIFYGFYIEPFWLTVSRVQIETPDLKPGETLRIVHLSDLHTEHLTRREPEIVARVADLSPDVIFWTGDYLNLSFLEHDGVMTDTRQLLEQLSAPYGVYAVQGSVDGPLQMQALFSGSSIRVLDDEWIDLPWPGSPVRILGIANRDFPLDRQEFTQLAPDISESAYSILLYHSPDLAPEAAEIGMDLVLAGHTHGGQIRLPFYGAVVTFSRYGKRFEMGQYQIQDTTLYVSRGLGMEGWWFAPRARFLCPPEIVVIDLVGAQP